LPRDSRLHVDEIMDLARIGLATGREDLRAELERLAVDRERWVAHGVSPGWGLDMAQRMIVWLMKQESSAK